MKSILEELRLGNICPETLRGRMSTEERKLAEQMADCYDRLIATLNDGQKELLEEFNDCQTEISYLEDKELFAQAFRLGARIVFEVMSKDFE